MVKVLLSHPARYVHFGEHQQFGNISKTIQIGPMQALDFTACMELHMYVKHLTLGEHVCWELTVK